MAHLELSFCGAFQAFLDDKPLINFHSPRVQGLLAFLALEAGRDHTRTALAALFWPDEPEATARQNLRQAIYQLRLLLEQSEPPPAVPFLRITRDTVQFDPASDHRLDVTAFLRHLKAGEPAAAVELYRGDLLVDLNGGSDRFDEWLILWRERLHILALGALHALTEAALAQANFAEAQSYARRQLALEPWREAAHRQLITALARGGQRSAALAQYELCRRILSDELDVEPEAETVALADQIRAGGKPARRPGTQQGCTRDRIGGDCGPRTTSARRIARLFASVRPYL